MGVGKLKLKKQKTTYEIFDQYGPLKINLSEAVSLKPAPAQNATAQATPQTTSQTTVQESVEVIGGGSNSGNVGGSDFELPDMSQVGGGGGAGGGGGDQASEDQQQDDAMQQQADAAAQQANEQAEKDRNQHWWMFIIAAVLGVLGFGGSQVAQHVRNNRNQRNMMDLQNNVVQRAENEAKRRAQSYARNKSHQVVSKARTKGRQAVRSNVSKIGDSVKGKRIGTDETTRQSAANGTNNQSATGSSRRTFGKKNNRNGEISI